MSISPYYIVIHYACGVSNESVWPEVTWLECATILYAMALIFTYIEEQIAKT